MVDRKSTSNKKVAEAKVIVLGDQRVGKTSLITRFANNTFDENQPETSQSSYVSQVVTLANNSQIKLNVWDTAGQERYNALNQLYFKGSNAAFIVYDCTTPQTFERVTQWVKQLKSYLTTEIPIMLVANKIDLMKEMDKDLIAQAKEYALKNNLEHTEASARSGKNVNAIFTELATRINKQNAGVQSRTAALGANRPQSTRADKRQKAQKITEMQYEDDLEDNNSKPVKDRPKSPQYRMSENKLQYMKENETSQDQSISLTKASFAKEKPKKSCC